MINTESKVRTLSQESTAIERAVKEIYGELIDRHAKYEKLRKDEAAYLELNRENINKLYSHQVDVKVKKGTDTPEARAEISRARLKLQDKLKSYDEDVKAQMRNIKRQYLKDCNIIIKRVSRKFNLTPEHVKRILGQNLNTEL